MKTPLTALWEEIERAYGGPAKDFLKAYYDERNRAYQQARRDNQKALENARRETWKNRAQTSDEPALEDDNPFQLSDSFREAVLGTDADRYDIEINRDSYE